MKASLSLDLDNLWSYQKTHGDPSWVDYSSYIARVVPHILTLTEGMRITVFVVGQDAALDHHRESLAALANAGHDIGNHSFRHEPWLHRYTPSEIGDELKRAHEAITLATGIEPAGFRGPGFSLSTSTLDALASMGYQYDATTFPTWVGPLARRFYFRSTSLPRSEMEKRRALFGSARDVLQPNIPYRWSLAAGELAELPVTTMPLARTPIHVSYLLYLSRFSQRLADAYFELALASCRLRGVGPSLLLHPLDLLGGDEVAELSFFPGMDLAGSPKRERTAGFIRQLTEHFEIVDCLGHVLSLQPLRRELSR